MLLDHNCCVELEVSNSSVQRINQHYFSATLPTPLFSNVLWKKISGTHSGGSFDFILSLTKSSSHMKWLVIRQWSRPLLGVGWTGFCPITTFSDSYRVSCFLKKWTLSPVSQQTGSQSIVLRPVQERNRPMSCAVWKPVGVRVQTPWDWPLWFPFISH